MAKSDLDRSYPHHARIWAYDKGAAWKLGRAVADIVAQRGCATGSIQVVCIGSDRSTGDCLGPVVGSMLKGISGSIMDEELLTVYGTVASPIHAQNLSECLSLVKGDEALTVAIDACLGRADLVGSVSVCDGPLYPGAGVHKILPPVGDVHITGTVNVSGDMGFAVLQSTRLHVVLSLATLIAKGLLIGLSVHSARRGSPLPNVPEVCLSVSNWL